MGVFRIASCMRMNPGPSGITFSPSSIEISITSPIMKSQSAFLKPTQTSVSQFTKVYVGEESNATSAPATVIYAAFPAIPQAKPPLAAVDIDDLVAEFEQSPESAQAIAQGRKWVAKTFYGNQPGSVAKLRLEKGWSQAELARRADTSQPYIARLESGRVDPGVRTVRKIAKALEVPMMTVVQALCPEDEQ